MKKQKIDRIVKAFYISLVFIFISCSYAQDNRKDNARLIGVCEGCEAVFEYDANKLTNTDTLPDFQEEGQRIMVSGTIYQPDGVTPAEDVILYVYHTDQEGIYRAKPDAEGWGKQHGYIRGWMKTAADGKYAFYTLKPGLYPDSSMPAHIHPIILEPNGKYYWMSSYHFSDDPLLNKASPGANPRGGIHGVLELKKADGLWTGKRDFILGRNIPNYE